MKAVDSVHPEEEVEVLGTHLTVPGRPGSLRRSLSISEMLPPPNDALFTIGTAQRLWMAAVKTVWKDTCEMAFPEVSFPVSWTQ